MLINIGVVADINIILLYYLGMSDIDLLIFRLIILVANIRQAVLVQTFCVCSDGELVASHKENQIRMQLDLKLGKRTVFISFFLFFLF